MCCLIRLISLTAAPYFEIVEIESAYLKVLHAHAVAMMCMKGTIRTIAHKSCRLWQRIVSFVGIVLPRWARKKKESGAERLKKSIKRKKEVSRETSKCYWENSKGLRSNDDESGEISERSPFPSRMAKNEKLMTYEKLPKTPEKRATVLPWLINNLQTRKLLEELGVILSDEEQSQFKLFRQHSY